MVLPNPQKISISFTINQKLLNQINSMIKPGNFSSTSDIVNTAITFFLGNLYIEKTEPDFDYSVIVEDIPIDNSAKTNISVTLSEYLDSELENLVKITQKNKSYIVRIALFRFFEYRNNVEKTKKETIVPDEKITLSKTELEEMIHEVVNKILNEK